MFVLKKRPSYFWPVKFRIAGINGKFEDQEFSGEFKRLSQQRIDEIITDVRRRDSEISDEAIANEVLIGWKDVNDEVGDPLLFNEESRNSLLSIAGVRGAVVRALFESVSGIVEKN